MIYTETCYKAVFVDIAWNTWSAAICEPHRVAYVRGEWAVPLPYMLEHGYGLFAFDNLVAARIFGSSYTVYEALGYRRLDLPISQRCMSRMTSEYMALERYRWRGNLSSWTWPRHTLCFSAIKLIRRA